MAKEKGTTQLALTVKRRDQMGTRPVNRLRQQGFVPGVVYGRGQEPLAVAVSRQELVKLLHRKASEHALVTLRLDETKSWEQPALVHAVQHDPVDGHVLHVDFHVIVLTERLRVKVPILLHGEPVGVKQEGGILEHFLREVEVECLPTEIPEHVVFDVTALAIGATIHVRDLAALKHAKITSDPDGVIASVHLPKVERVEEAAPAVTEPEVIREKKEGEETAPAEDVKAEKPEKAEKSEPKKEAKS